MQVIRLTENFIEFTISIQNIKKLNTLYFCGFQNKNGTFQRKNQTIVPINDSTIFIRSGYNENIGQLIANLSAVVSQ